MKLKNLHGLSTCEGIGWLLFKAIYSFVQWTKHYHVNLEKVVKSSLFAPILTKSSKFTALPLRKKCMVAFTKKCRVAFTVKTKEFFSLNYHEPSMDPLDMLLGPLGVRGTPLRDPLEGPP